MNFFKELLTKQKALSPPEDESLVSGQICESINKIAIKPFIDATLSVLEKEASVRAEAGKPCFNNNVVDQGDLSVIMGFTGHVKGTISISFKDAFIVKIASKMLGKEINDINNEVIDVVTKLTNLIIGQVSKEFEHIGKAIVGTSPMVFAGNHTLTSMAKGSKMDVPFKTNTDDFTISVCVNI